MVLGYARPYHSGATVMVLELGGAPAQVAATDASLDGIELRNIKHTL